MNAQEGSEEGAAPRAAAKKSKAGLILGIGCGGCLLLLCLAGLVLWMGAKAFKARIPNEVNGYSGRVVTALESEDLRPEMGAAFDKIIALAKEGKVSLMTFGILTNQVDIALSDGVVTDAECEPFFALLRDIVAKDGSVSIFDYAEQR